jgi:hypothetical protein
VQEQARRRERQALLVQGVVAGDGLLADVLLQLLPRAWSPTAAPRRRLWPAGYDPEQFPKPSQMGLPTIGSALRRCRGL